MSERIAPGFLVASPSLSCPFFEHSLVLVVEHGPDGSFGFVVNKTAGIGLDAIADEMSLPADPTSAPEIPVMLGGPVAPSSGWLLFDPLDRPAVDEEMLKLDSRIAVTASVDVLKRFVNGEMQATDGAAIVGDSAAGAGGDAPKASARAMLLLGYAGWSPGQLESEMTEGAWIPVDIDAELVFGVPDEARWEMALRGLGIDPGRVVGKSVADA